MAGGFTHMNGANVSMGPEDERSNALAYSSLNQGVLRPNQGSIPGTFSTLLGVDSCPTFRPRGPPI